MTSQVDKRMLTETLDILKEWSQKPQPNNAIMFHLGISMPSPIKMSDRGLGFALRGEDKALITIGEAFKQLSQDEWDEIEACIQSRFNVSDKWESTQGWSFVIDHSVHQSMRDAAKRYHSLDPWNIESTEGFEAFVKPKESKYIAKKVAEWESELQEIRQFVSGTTGKVKELLVAIGAKDIRETKPYASGYNYAGEAKVFCEHNGNECVVSIGAKDGVAQFSVRYDKSFIDDLDFKKLQSTIKFFHELNR